MHFAYQFVATSTNWQEVVDGPNGIDDPTTLSYALCTNHDESAATHSDSSCRVQYEGAGYASAGEDVVRLNTLSVGSGFGAVDGKALAQGGSGMQQCLRDHSGVAVLGSQSVGRKERER